jgi:hypothetical protein
MLDQISTFLNHLPSLLQAAAPWLGGGLLATGVVQFLKKKLSLESDKVLMTLLFSTSFVEVAVNYLNSQVSQNPTVLGQRTAAIAGIATALYRLAVKPASNILTDAKALRDAQANHAEVHEHSVENGVITSTLPAPAVSDTAELAQEQPSVFEG